MKASQVKAETDMSMPKKPCVQCGKPCLPYGYVNRTQQVCSRACDEAYHRSYHRRYSDVK